MTLRDAIPVGRLNAKTKAELAAALGTTTRDVESGVEQLRKAGKAPVCSDGRGYWRPMALDEYEKNVAARKRRALNQLLTIRGEKRLIRKWKNQVIEQQTLDLVA